MRQEVVKIEDLLSIGTGSNMDTRGNFLEKPLIKADREVLIYDIWYKRLLTDILLFRERQVPYLSSHKTQVELPLTRPTNARFADFEDITPLLMSFGIGAGLLLLV